MIRRHLLLAGLGLTAGALAPTAWAHHGWGSYDASQVLNLDGTVETIDPNNPHGELRLKTADKNWTVTLSPPARMVARGKPLSDIKVGDRLLVVGYPSRSRPDEMRAERVTHNGFTVELR